MPVGVSSPRRPSAPSFAGIAPAPATSSPSRRGRRRGRPSAAGWPTRRAPRRWRRPPPIPRRSAAGSPSMPVGVDDRADRVEDDVGRRASTMPAMICLTVATGGDRRAPLGRPAPAGRARVRAPAMTKPMPLMNSSDADEEQPMNSSHGHCPDPVSRTLVIGSTASVPQIQRRHDDHVEQRRRHQPAQDHDRHRRLNLAAGLAAAERERNQRQPGRHRGHQNRHQPFAARRARPPRGSRSRPRRPSGAGCATPA